MKRILLIPLLSVACASSGASGESPPLQGFGRSWRARNAQIRWEFSLQELPTSAKVYRIVPNAVPPEVLSNLLALAGLTEADRFKPSVPGVRDEDLYFHDAKQQHYVGVIRDQGLVVLENKGIIALPDEIVEGVPGDSEAVHLAQRILPKIGISETQLVRIPGSNTLAFGRSATTSRSYDREKGNTVTEVRALSIRFNRSFDGIPALGRGPSGGIMLQFGNCGQLAALDMIWPRVEPKGVYQVATKDQFLQRLKDGECVCADDIPEVVDSLTIKEIRPYYLLGNAGEPEQEIHPIAAIKADATYTGHAGEVLLLCPLLVFPTAREKH